METSRQARVAHTDKIARFIWQWDDLGCQAGGESKPQGDGKQ
jgi:hypothetical protein